MDEKLAVAGQNIKKSTRQKTLKMPDQGFLQLAFRVFILEIQKLKDKGIFYFFFREHGIAWLRFTAPGQHGRLVLRQNRALVELGTDLPVKLTNRPSPVQGLTFIEIARRCWTAKILQTVSAESAMQGRRLSFATHCELRNRDRNGQRGRRQAV